MNVRLSARALRHLGVCAATAVLGFASVAQAQYEDIIDRLNSHATVKGGESVKNYRPILDAFLQLDPPPFPMSARFNTETIHPGMADWDLVKDWAESGTALADALIAARAQRTIIFGLPYGIDNVPAEYAEAGLFVEIGGDDSLRNIDFYYLDAVEVICAFCTAEVYRQMELGDADRAMDLAMSQILWLRQLCDRDFVEEKLYSIGMLSITLQNLRDVFYTFRDAIPYQRYVDIAYIDIPYLRPDRARLFMPEADRIVAERLIEEVFNPATEQPDPEQFRAVFGAIQSESEPLTRFGAASRWENIASLHGSLQASLEKLTALYDDWWRRWRLSSFDSLLDRSTAFERTNEIRYAAVLYSLDDIKSVFDARDNLICEVRATAIAAGICGYAVEYGRNPSNRVNLYGQVLRQVDDVDPFNPDEEPFKFLTLTSRSHIDIPEGRLWVERGEVMVWSLGQDNFDDKGHTHRNTGDDSDIVVWPPIKAIAREAGMID